VEESGGSLFFVLHFCAESLRFSNMKPTRRFICSYHHDDSEWSITIDAYDWADAKARIQKLGFLRLEGELIHTVTDRFGWFARAYCWVRNLFV
jgi:hypothetical protein